MSVIYRLINRQQTFQDSPLGAIPHNINEMKTFLSWLSQQQKFGEFFMSSVDFGRQNSIYQCTSGKRVIMLIEKTIGLKRLFQTGDYLVENIKQLTQDIRDSKKIESVCQLLRKIPNVGEFFAWQMYCDLSEAKVLPFGKGVCNYNDVELKDDFVLFGPGSSQGLQLIFGADANKIECITKLRDKQEEYLQNFIVVPFFKPKNLA